MLKVLDDKGRPFHINDVIDNGKRKRDLCKDELKSAREQLEAARALYQFANF